jgi:hypothetical protein
VLSALGNWDKEIVIEISLDYDAPIDFFVSCNTEIEIGDNDKFYVTDFVGEDMSNNKDYRKCLLYLG